ncbi:hypothetical protein PMIN04_004599 [Paraphaeosphaeria minitans]
MVSRLFQKDDCITALMSLVSSKIEDDLLPPSMYSDIAHCPPSFSGHNLRMLPTLLHLCRLFFTSADSSSPLPTILHLYRLFFTSTDTEHESPGSKKNGILKRAAPASPASGFDGGARTRC